MGLLSLAIWTPIFFGIVLLALGRDEQARAVRWVALIGAVVLTHRESRAVRAHQNIAKQNARRPQDATELKNPESGKGVDIGGVEL